MTYSLKFRRRREGKTNYHKRLKLLLSNTPRLVIRRTNTGTYCQFITYDPKGDKVLAQATPADLKKAGLTQTSGKSVPASYLVGYAAGVRAKKAGVKNAIVDTGMFGITKGNRIFAAVKGALDAGIQIPVSQDTLPSAERIAGKHINDHRNVSINIDQIKSKLQ